MRDKLIFPLLTILFIAVCSFVCIYMNNMHEQGYVEVIAADLQSETTGEITETTKVASESSQTFIETDKHEQTTSVISETQAFASTENAETFTSTEVNEQKELININTATAKELETLPGIGEVTAQKIIDYRTESGGFDSIEEIMEVKGIGEKKFEAIKELITV